MASFRRFLIFGGFAFETDLAEAVGGAVVGAVEADFVAGEGFLAPGRM